MSGADYTVPEIIRFVFIFDKCSYISLSAVMIWRLGVCMRQQTGILWSDPSEFVKFRRPPH